MEAWVRIFFCYTNDFLQLDTGNVFGNYDDNEHPLTVSPATLTQRNGHHYHTHT